MPSRRMLYALVTKPWSWLVKATLALLVLAAVFALYLQPDFLVMLVNQVWACF